MRSPFVFTDAHISSGWRPLILGACFCWFSVLPVFGQSFSTPTLYTVGLNTVPTPVAVGDFNGDGIPDLVVSNRGTNNVSVLLGNGDGDVPGTHKHCCRPSAFRCGRR